MRRAIVRFAIRGTASLLATLMLLAAAPARPAVAADDNGLIGPAPLSSQQPIALLGDRNTKGNTKGGTKGGTKGTKAGTGTNKTTNDGTTAATTNTANTTGPTLGTNKTTNDGTTAATTNTANTTADEAGAVQNNQNNQANQNNQNAVAGFQAPPPAAAGFQAQGQAAEAQPAGNAVLGVQQLPATATDAATAAMLAAIGAGAIGTGLLVLRNRR